MCGLAGAILGKKRRRRDELRVIGGIVTELLILNETRGTDAAGVAVVRKDGSHKLLKRPGPASALVEEKLFHRIIELDNKVTVLLGHTRRKTRGSERNSLNNHPACVGAPPILAATHNGAIFDADALAKRLNLPRRAQVDSEVLYRILHRAKNIAELRRMLALCRGRMSVAYVRMDKPERLCLLKGDMPLSAVWVPRLRTVFYASEGWMLDEALAHLDRVQLEIEPMTLSFFDATAPLDFTQEDVAFRTPEATLWQPTASE
jgi:glucosamine 6-phosphate synthetase-like amidotransferase/phosphosugar isomerase protein